MTKGWYNDRVRHSLSARGIRSRMIKAQATPMFDESSDDTRGHIAAKIELVGIDATESDVEKLAEEIEESIRSWMQSHKFAKPQEQQEIGRLIDDLRTVQHDFRQYPRMMPEDRIALVANAVKRMRL